MNFERPQLGPAQWWAADSKPGKPAKPKAKSMKKAGTKATIQSVRSILDVPPPERHRGPAEKKKQTMFEERAMQFPGGKGTDYQGRENGFKINTSETNRETKKLIHGENCAFTLQSAKFPGAKNVKPNVEGKVGVLDDRAKGQQQPLDITDKITGRNAKAVPVKPDNFLKIGARVEGEASALPNKDRPRPRSRSSVAPVAGKVGDPGQSRSGAARSASASRAGARNPHVPKSKVTGKIMESNEGRKQLIAAKQNKTQLASGGVKITDPGRENMGCLQERGKRR